MSKLYVSLSRSISSSLTEKRPSSPASWAVSPWILGSTLLLAPDGDASVGERVPVLFSSTSTGAEGRPEAWDDCQQALEHALRDGFEGTASPCLSTCGCVAPVLLVGDRVAGCWAK